MSTAPRPRKFEEAIEGSEQLAGFLRAMRKLEQRFCDAMADGVDFTLRLEIKGDKRRIVHTRVHDDSWDRPAGTEKTREAIATDGGDD